MEGGVDLTAVVLFGLLSGNEIPGGADAYWQNVVRATHGFFTVDDVWTDRGTVRWRPLREVTALRRAFSCHGFCAAYLSRKSPGHRSLSVRSSFEALPHGFSRADSPHYTFRRQRSPRLAHLCRLCTGAHSSGQKTLRIGNSRSRTLRNSLRA